MAGEETMQLGVLNVRRLGFGTMQLTGPGVWGPPRDHDGAIEVLRRSVELGVNLIDTADSYGPNVAEELVHEALYPVPRDADHRHEGRIHEVAGRISGRSAVDRDYLRQQCEGSLRRLGVEQIDLFQLHRIDPHVDADEQFGLLKALRDEGKVREVGLSEVSVAQIEAARRHRSDRQRAESLQHRPTRRRRRRRVLRTARTSDSFPGFPWAAASSPHRVDRSKRLRRAHGATVPQICLAWLLRRSPVMLPIPGRRRSRISKRTARRSNVTLSDAEYQELTDARKAIRRWAMSA